MVVISSREEAFRMFKRVLGPNASKVMYGKNFPRKTTENQEYAKEIYISNCYNSRTMSDMEILRQRN